jgi:molybdenum cofactor biosynthesis enzyme MoaA
MWKAYEGEERRDLADLVRLAKSVGIERIAISTNGSVHSRVYRELVEAGANDFSVSLDACCAETGDKMAGGKRGAWHRVVENIKILSSLTYVTVGVVFTPENVQEFKEIVRFASDDLGVSDIRILTSAQWNALLADVQLDQRFLDKHPILRYRMTNFGNSRHVRGLRPGDSSKCVLMVDDMAVLDGAHYPCIIYMREQGQAVGKIDYTLSPAEAGKKVREERVQWIKSRYTKLDPICSKNCLDVCIDHNNRARDMGNMI